MFCLVEWFLFPFSNCFFSFACFWFSNPFYTYRYIVFLMIFIFTLCSKYDGGYDRRDLQRFDRTNIFNSYKFEFELFYISFVWKIKFISSWPISLFIATNVFYLFEAQLCIINQSTNISRSLACITCKNPLLSKKEKKWKNHDIKNRKACK